MSKQQRLSAVVGVGLDRTKENHMVAAIISIGRAALKVRNAVRKNRRVAKAMVSIELRQICPPKILRICSQALAAMRQGR